MQAKNALFQENPEETLESRDHSRGIAYFYNFVNLRAFFISRPLKQRPVNQPSTPYLKGLAWQYRHELTPHLHMYIGWVGCAKKVHSLSPIKKTTMLFDPKPHWGFHQCVILHCSCISQKCFMLKMRSKFQLLSGLAVTEVHITNFLFLWISTWFFYTWQIYWPWLLGEPPWVQGEPPWL